MVESEDALKERLPSAVYHLGLRLGAKPGDGSPAVRLTQTGQLKRSLASKSWLAFTATQIISTRACEFDWQAKAGPFGVVTARDALQEDEGRFDIMALGVPLARAPHTPALMRGELMRYLAEIPWAPDAIFANATLRWRTDGPERLIVGAGDAETAVEVTLGLDSDGRIASAFAPDRPRNAVEPLLPTPWSGRFSDYRLHLGRWLPFEGEVAWVIDGEEGVYWQGRLESWAVTAD